jgi:UDP-GlcNAc:undecaprenyl-phosphate GlcNAc-1-phosphate transferase
VRTYLYIMVIAAAVTYLATPLARRLARRIGAVTPVRDRDVHAVPIPRMGGTAMLIGFAAAVGVASRIPFMAPVFRDNSPWVVLLGGAGVCLLGIADDLWSLDALTKFAGQSLVAGVMAWQGIKLVSLPIAGITVPSSDTLLVITVIAVVGTMNAVNFVDGLDGLAAGIVGIAASAFFVYSYLLTRTTQDFGDNLTPSRYSFASLACLVTAALLGTCLGFLPHNINPARVFMGDSGSMLIGLLLASSTVAITGQVDGNQVEEAQIVPAFLPLVLPLAVIALPLVDVALAVIRRTRAGRMPWQPDKQHLHHRLLRMGHSHGRAVLILYVWTATVAFGVVSVAFVSPMTAAGLGSVAAVIALALTLGPLRARGRRGVSGHAG